MPPTLDGMDGKTGGVMVRADADPPLVVGDVIDAIGHGASQCRSDKVVDLDRFGRCFGAIFASLVFEITDQFLLFGIHRDDRAAVPKKRLSLALNVAKLGVTIRVLLSFCCCFCFVLPQVGFSFVGQGRPSYWPFTDRILDFDTLLELEFDSYGPETGTGSWIAGVGYSGR